MSTDDDDDRVIVVPDDLPERKRLQYADLERRYRARLREIAGCLAQERGLPWPDVPAGRVGALMVDAEILVKDWDPDRAAGPAGELTELERLVADCRELRDQMTDLVEYVIGPQ